MHWLAALIAALLGYLIGAIPVGVLVCRLFGVDIRQIGSGRTGTTNAWRAAGLKAAIPTLLGDALKGVIAIWITTQAYVYFFPDPSAMIPAEALTRLSARQLSEALAGGFAIVGHNWSPFLGFKGGAGGITAAATTMMISPLVGGMVWLIGAFLIWWSRMASVATFSVGVSSFVILLMLNVSKVAQSWPYVIYGLIALVAIFIALQRNRDQIRDGDERVITLW